MAATNSDVTTPGSAPARGVSARATRDPCLDGVRALAVVAVFLFHGALGSRPLVAHLAHWVVHFDGGVEIFFVLSGYLIYRPFVVAHLAGATAPDLRKYALRRVSRIFPAYWVALALTWALHTTTFSGPSNAIAHITLTYSYWSTQFGRGIAQSWTLVVELSFYAFAPLWALLVRRVARRRGDLRTELAGAALLLVLGYPALWAARFHHPPTVLTVLPPALPTLAAGMLLAVLAAEASRSPVLARRLRTATAWAGAWWLAAFALLAWLAVHPYAFLLASPAQRFRHDVLQAWIAILLVAPAALGDAHRGLVRRVLRARPVVYVGVVSYALYLWHGYVLHLFEHRLGLATSSLEAVGWLAAAFTASVVIASASWHLVERPLLSSARRAAGPRP